MYPVRERESSFIYPEISNYELGLASDHIDTNYRDTV